MANKKENQNNAPLSQRVKDWIEEQGYSLEMRVAKTFRNAGFNVSQFKHFVDQESQSVRPVDVVATIPKVVANTEVSIQLFIECKYSTEQPWVILTTTQRFGKFKFFSRVLQHKHPSSWKSITNLQGRLVGRILVALDNKNEIPALLSIRNAGYLVKRVLVNDRKNDVAYQATVQVSKSVEAQDAENELLYSKILEDMVLYEDIVHEEINFPLTIIFPIIVINGSLFESYLGENDEMQVAEVDYGTVFVPYRQKETKKHSQVTLSAVTIVTETYLEQYTQDMKKAIYGFLEDEKPIHEIIEYEKSKLNTEITF